MEKVKLNVREYFTGGKNSEDVFTTVLLSSTITLTGNVETGIMKTNEQPQDSLSSGKGAEYGTSEE